MSSTSRMPSPAHALVTLAGLTLVSLAQAQGSMYGNPADGTARAPWYVVPSASVFDPEDRFGVNRRGEGFGLRAGKVISPSWDIQFGPSFASSSKGGYETQRATLDLVGMYMFSRQRFRPFALFGVGAEYDRVKSPGPTVSGTSPFVTAGLGFQYAFNETWGVQADARRSHSYLRNNDFGFNRANSNLFTLSLIYVIGQSTPQKRAIVQAPPMQAPEPAPVTPPVVEAPGTMAAAPAEPPQRVEKLTVSASELFAFDSAQLPAAHGKLDEVVGYLTRNPQISRVTITGHTDRIGTPSYNQKLSERRAEVVRQYMIDRGVSSNRLTATGVGEDQALVQCTDKNMPALILCLQPNRRVVVE